MPGCGFDEVICKWNVGRNRRIEELIFGNAVMLGELNISNRLGKRIERGKALIEPRAEQVAAASRRDIADPTQGDEYHYFQADVTAGNLQGKLPHWRQDGDLYFVTFRLSDSIPQDRL